MKKKILLALLLVLCLGVALCSCGGDEPPATETTSSSEQTNTGTGNTDTNDKETYSTGFEFVEEGDSYAIMGVGTCKDTEVKIPKKYKNKPVTRIHPYAFAYNQSIKSVVVPDTVYDVCESAFQGCTSLESVILPNKVTYISQDAFADCTALQSVTIGEEVECIGEGAFRGCGELRKISIPDTIQKICRGAFEGCDKLNYREYSGFLCLGNSKNPRMVLVKPKYDDMEECIIDGNIKLIADGAFEGYTPLTSIVIDDDTDVSIGEYAFAQCPNVEFLLLGDKVKSIGYAAFFECGKIESVVIPDSVKSIGSSAFKHCYSLKTVEIGGGVKEMGNEVFAECMQITSVTVKEGAECLGDAMLYCCQELESIKIPASVKKIGDGIFEYCVSLKTIEVDELNTNYRSHEDCLYSYDGKVLVAFPAGKECEEFIIPDCVETVGAYAFADSDVKTVHFLSGLRAIEKASFVRCFNLERVILPEGVVSIGNEAFSNCTSLKTVDLPSSLEVLGSYVFHSCDSIEYTEHEGGLYLGNETNPYLVLVGAKDKEITGFVINNQTKFIHSLAFMGCYSLEKIFVSKDIIGIGGSAFYECDALTIYCEAIGQPETWEPDWNASECPVIWGYTVK